MTDREMQDASPPEETGGLRWTGGWMAAAIYFALAVLYFLPAFAVGSHIYGSDYLAGAYFAHDFISERFAAGALPKWVPYLYGGLPLFANPGSAFYPFRFVADFLFPTSRIFPTLYVIQFTIAGIGMYWLSRELGARRWVAFVAGLAFQFTGLAMSFVLAGHDGRIIVATFAPLFLFFLHRGVRTGRWVDFGGMAAVLGTSLLSFQIQSNYYLLLAGAAWAGFLLVRRRRHLSGRALAKRTAQGLAAVVLAFGMAAVNFLPFLDYVDASPRGGPGRGYEYATSWSMPPAEITGLALPEISGMLENYRGDNPFKLHTEYVGAVVILLTLVGAWVSRRDPRWWFFALLSLFALSISFGGHTPLYRLYYALLPGTTKFRAPSIAFFLVSTSLVAMAGLALERLATLRAAVGGGDDADDLQAVTWILAAAAGLALVLLLAFAGQAGTDARGQALARGAFRVALVTWLCAGALWAWLRGTFDARILVPALALLVVADLWVVDRHFFDTVPPPEDMFAADGVVRTLEQEPGPFRVWVLPFASRGAQPYRNNGNYLMYHHIAQAGGEHGNHIQRWGELVGAGEQTYVDWHNFIADLEGLVQPVAGDSAPGPARPTFLAAANVRYIVSTLALPGLREVYRGPEALIYEVPGALPRAWLAAQAVVAPPGEALERLSQPGFDPGTTAVLERPLEAPLPAGPLTGEATVVDYQPDEVRVATEADRAAVLVLSDNHYPGWEVSVDDVPAALLRVDHTLRGVVVPAGTHEVVFRFRPRDLYAGLWISVLSALAVLGAVVAPLARRRWARSG